MLCCGLIANQHKQIHLWELSNIKKTNNNNKKNIYIYSLLFSTKTSLTHQNVKLFDYFFGDLVNFFSAETKIFEWLVYLVIVCVTWSILLMLHICSSLKWYLFFKKWTKWNLMLFLYLINNLLREKLENTN